MQKTEDNLMKDGSELDGDYDLIRIEIYPEFEGGLCKNKIEIITNVEECQNYLNFTPHPTDFSTTNYINKGTLSK